MNNELIAHRHGATGRCKILSKLMVAKRKKEEEKQATEKEEEE
jgi:hypothetical protein